MLNQIFKIDIFLLLRQKKFESKRSAQELPNYLADENSLYDSQEFTEQSSAMPETPKFQINDENTSIEN